VRGDRLQSAAVALIRKMVDPRYVCEARCRATSLIVDTPKVAKGTAHTRSAKTAAASQPRKTKVRAAVTAIPEAVDADHSNEDEDEDSDKEYEGSGNDNDEGSSNDEDEESSDNEDEGSSDNEDEGSSDNEDEGSSDGGDEAADDGEDGTDEDKGGSEGAAVDEGGNSFCEISDNEDHPKGKADTGEGPMSIFNEKAASPCVSHLFYLFITHQ
jgi:hypothetical protein